MLLNHQLAVGLRFLALVIGGVRLLPRVVLVKVVAVFGQHGSHHVVELLEVTAQGRQQQFFGVVGMQIRQLIIRARIPLFTLVDDVFEDLSAQLSFDLLLHTDLPLKTTLLLPLHFFYFSLFLVGHCVDPCLLYLV